MIAFPTFRIYVKPLLPKQAVEMDPKKVLKSVQREALKAVRDEIQDQAFSNRAKIALKKSVTTKLGPNSLTVFAKHPAFFPLIDGQRREQMTWLTKAKRPIPIILDNGDMIFRNASPRSMSRGRWYHPGRPATDVIEKARKQTREVVKRRVSKAVQRQIRAAMGVR